MARAMSYGLHPKSITLEELTVCYETWRDRAFRAAEIGDWHEAVRCFQTTAHYDGILGFLKRNATD